MCRGRHATVTALAWCATCRAAMGYGTVAATLAALRMAPPPPPAPMVPFTPMERPQGTSKRREQIDYDTCTDAEWNHFVMFGPVERKE